MKKKVVFLKFSLPLEAVLQDYFQENYEVSFQKDNLTNKDSNIYALIIYQDTQEDLITLCQDSTLKTAIIQDKENALREYSGNYTPFIKPITLYDLKKWLDTGDEDFIIPLNQFTLFTTKRYLKNNITQEQIILTQKEAEILQYLYNHPGTFHSKESLLKHIWGYGSAVTTHTLETHIYRLRQKMKLPGDEAVLINTPEGYKLNV